MTPFTFRYRDTSRRMCEGTVTRIRQGDPLEADIEVNGWSFHVIVGTHLNGNYICIPNWSVGSELANLDDEFWNYERLKNHTKLKVNEAKALSRALAEIDERL